MKGMKGGSPYKLRVRNLSLSLTALICLTLAVWAWEKTPHLTTYFQQVEQFEMSSSVLSPVNSVKTTPVNNFTRQNPLLVGVKSNPPKEEVPSKLSIKGIPSEPAKEDNSSADTPSISPAGGSAKSSAGERKDGENVKMVSSNKDCDYAKGKWVADSKRPLYSGSGCRQWLSGMWACRLNHRTDFAYEHYRWQPKDCEMPDFHGSKFLRRMKHKTIAFIGDSLGRQQFQSMMCMVTGGRESPEVEDIGKQYGLVIPRGAKRPDGWAYRFPKTNTTILYYWSASLCALEPINKMDPATNVAMHLDRPVQFLQQNLPRFDVLVLNTGHHWNRGKLTANRWVMYVNGTPNADKKIAGIGNAKNLTIHSVVKWLDSRLPQYPRLKVFFRTMSPRHFENGDWNTGGSCDNTIPLVGGSDVNQNSSSDPATEDAVKGSKVKLLDITALSQLRSEGHVSKFSIRPQPGMYDCLHWCLPGIPDTWNELLAAQV
ncbi:uncharacterized protein A4U43_C08F15690 [Asparagus officinalis]|uniref:protein trichome birefringence-like 14 n=1 Tax=Asparagus officinalis TaxID=4686 RepID=UPI00098E0703|nr:protein trichome birefringence-like 14 [Asparagus officinalis]ONK60221.1 uncharacterized protein A4U43_C08F15690 [Asparagus officinalis]